MTSSDPYTAELPLCDDDGIVRGGTMHHGRDYPCTGSAHYSGAHIRCTSPAHEPYRHGQRYADAWRACEVGS